MENMIGELFQPMHLLVVGIVALFVFGPDKLPQLGRTLGKAVRELRGAMNEPDEVTKDSTK
nr:twin-arginine translocation protein TatB [Nitratidesulfovibrio sp. HK-II]